MVTLPDLTVMKKTLVPRTYFKLVVKIQLQYIDDTYLNVSQCSYIVFTAIKYIYDILTFLFGVE